MTGSSLKIDDEGEQYTPTRQRHQTSVLHLHSNIPLPSSAQPQKEVKRSITKKSGAPSTGSDSEVQLPGDLTNANLLSRFDSQDRDAIGRQMKLDQSKCPLSRTGSWSKFISGDSSSSSEDDDRLEVSFDDCTGISAPLYEVADAIFQFPRQKFFRRQVIHVKCLGDKSDGLRSSK